MKTIRPQPFGERFKRSPAFAGFILFLLTLAVFLPTLKNDFVNFDDPTYVTDNVHVSHGLKWSGICWAVRATAGGIWLPVTWISHMADCQMYGLEPWGHHLTSVLIHALSTALLFGWLFRMTGAAGRSFVVAGLFGLHPLRVESVAWVAERKDVLSVLFCLLTLWAYTEYVRRSGTGAGARKFYFLTVLSFALGLMAKPMLVTLPFVLLLLDCWPLSRVQGSGFKVQRLVREKIPFFALSLIASVIAFFVQRHERAMVVFAHLPLMDRMGNGTISCVRYLGKLFYPVHLGVYYPFPDQWSLLTIFSAALLLAIVSLLALQQFRRRPYLLVGWLWFLGTLVPVIGLVQVGQQSMADRYTYIPDIGLLIAAVWGMAELLGRSRSIAFFASAVVIVGCAALTIRQIDFWKDSETLFRHALAVTQNNAIAEANLASTLVHKGELDEAIVHYQKSLAAGKNYADTHVNYGNALVHKGDVASAIVQYQEALKLKPDMPQAYYNYGVLLYRLGKVDEAITNYQKAVEYDPAYAAAYYNLGLVFYEKEQMTDAIVNFRKAADLNPDLVQTYGNLGSALLKAGQTEGAIESYQKYLAINPTNINVQLNLSIAYSAGGRTNDAVLSAQKALRLAEQQNNVALIEAIKAQLTLWQTNSLSH